MSREADQLLTALHAAGAYGPAAAVPQRKLARFANLPLRAVQEDLALELLAAGYPLATTCRHPPGVFLATTAAELEPYLRQLENRCKGLCHRRRLVRASWRNLRDREAAQRKPPAEPDGQLLFVGSAPADHRPGVPS